MNPWNSIRGCADGDSESCKDLQKQGARRALEEAGVDPDLADEAIECANTRDSEVCAKVSAKAAAVYACTAATEGAGADICQKYAPVIVEKIWPVVGPPLVSVWDISLQSLGHLQSVLNGVLGSFASVLGFGGDDGPTRTEKLNEIRWAGVDILDKQYKEGVKAAMLADIESRREFGLQVPMSVRHIDGELGDMARARVNRYFVPKLKPVCIVGRGRKTLTDVGPINFRIVSPDYVPTNSEIMLRSFAPPSGWRYGEPGFSPAGFEVINQPGVTWRVQDVADAYGVVVAQRLKAIRDGSVDAVATAIAESAEQSEKQSSVSSSSGFVLLATFAALAAGGYYLWTRKR